MRSYVVSRVTGGHVEALSAAKDLILQVMVIAASLSGAETGEEPRFDAISACRGGVFFE